MSNTSTIVSWISFTFWMVERVYGLPLHAYLQNESEHLRRLVKQLDFDALQYLVSLPVTFSYVTNLVNIVQCMIFRWLQAILYLLFVVSHIKSLARQSSAHVLTLKLHFAHKNYLPHNAKQVDIISSDAWGIIVDVCDCVEIVASPDRDVHERLVRVSIPARVPWHDTSILTHVY